MSAEEERELVRAFLAGYAQAVRDYQAYVQLLEPAHHRRWSQRARKWLIRGARHG